MIFYFKGVDLCDCHEEALACFLGGGGGVLVFEIEVGVCFKTDSWPPFIYLSSFFFLFSVSVFVTLTATPAPINERQSQCCCRLYLAPRQQGHIPENGTWAVV